MKLRHIIRDSLIKIRDIYYRYLLKKPRIYYQNKNIPKSFKKIKRFKTEKFSQFISIRPNSEDKIEKLKKNIGSIKIKF